MSFALNRLILYARDVEGTVAFYEKHFGFKVLRLPGDNKVGGTECHARSNSRSSTSRWDFRNTALELGTHRFYEKRADGSTNLDATPGFANVWKKTPDGWKLTRVLSYGHP